MSNPSNWPAEAMQLHQKKLALKSAQNRRLAVIRTKLRGGARAGTKVVLGAAALGIGLKAAAKGQELLQRRKKYGYIDVYPEYGYTTADTAPYREPYFNVYEAIMQDLVNRVES